jgi:spore coat protein U-like protein
MVQIIMQGKKMKARIALFAAALGLCAQIAHAASSSNTFVVQTSISSACSVSASTLNFGSYSPGNASPTDNTSTVSVYCTSGTAYVVRFDVGTGGGTFGTRTLTTGSNTLNYNLYTTAGRSIVLGDGTASTQTAAGNGAGLLTASTHTVYGRIPAGQDQPPGNYNSTITVTVEYT